jgi:hypothetical protein
VTSLGPAELHAEDERHVTGKHAMECVKNIKYCKLYPPQEHKISPIIEFCTNKLLQIGLKPLRKYFLSALNDGHFLPPQCGESHSLPSWFHDLCQLTSLRNFGNLNDYFGSFIYSLKLANIFLNTVYYFKPDFTPK